MCGILAVLLEHSSASGYMYIYTATNVPNATVQSHAGPNFACLLARFQVSNYSYLGSTQVKSEFLIALDAQNLGTSLTAGHAAQIFALAR